MRVCIASVGTAKAAGGGIEYHGGVDGGEGDWSHQGGGLPIFSLSMTKKGVY